MSKERELLKRWLIDFGKIHPDVGLMKDTQALLAQPEQTEQEPVAWMYDWDDGHGMTYVNLLTTDTELTYLKTAFNVMPLYTAPPISDVIEDLKEELKAKYHEGYMDGKAFKDRHITLRDHFAGLAMQGLSTIEGYTGLEFIAKDAYNLADAMIAERDKNEEEN